MFTTAWKLLLASSLCLALPATALAQDLPAPPAVVEAPPPALPDAALRAIGDRPVALQGADGRELAVHILAVEPEQLVISVITTGQVMTLPRASVVKVRLLPSAPPPSAAVDREEPAGPVNPSRTRHLAVNLSVAPGFDLDLDAGLFHGFANLGIILPLATNGNIVPFSVGLGVGIPVSRTRPTLKLDLFVHLNVIGNTATSTYYSSSTASMGFGAGIGLHYTWNNGLTLGFTVPILGYAVALGSGNSGYSSGTATGVANYFLTSSEALPLGYIGYRF